MSKCPHCERLLAQLQAALEWQTGAMLGVLTEPENNRRLLASIKARLDRAEARLFGASAAQHRARRRPRKR